MLGETIFWELETNGMLMITGTGEMDDYNVGSYYDESTHSPLKKYCESITQLVIEDGITTIGNGVFWECINLKSVELPEGIEKIGDDAFYKCSGLEEIYLPDDLKSIGESAFYNCVALKEIIMPDSVETIKNSVFSDCRSMTSIKISKGIKEIPNSMIFNCVSLKSIEIPENVTNIDKSAFLYCESLESIVIPGNVTNIGEEAFGGCESLKSVTIQEGVASIGEEAFYYCKDLKKVVMPESIVSIENNAFKDCSGMLTFECVKDSYSYEYAKKNGIYVEVVENGKNDSDDDRNHYQPVQNQVRRISGSDRYMTCFYAANNFRNIMGMEKFETVIIVSGKNYADALSGSYLACKKNAPILMTNGKNIQDLFYYLVDTLESNGKIYILGGTAAVSAEVEQVLSLIGNVERLAGKNRYETNLMILEEAGVDDDDDIIVCTGRSFADSLSASALGKPIILVGKSLTYDQEGFMVKHENGNRYYIIGGTGAVDAYTENVIRGYGPTKRIGGSTRYETSVLVAEEFFDNPKTVVLAYAKNFPDGLSGGPLAYSMNAPLILTATNNYEDAQDYVYDHNINNGTILGGSTLISDITAVSIFLRF